MVRTLSVGPDLSQPLVIYAEMMPDFVGNHRKSKMVF
jgi:hypothetical protein